MKKRIFGLIATGLFLTLAAAAPARATPRTNGFWINGPWTNGFWTGGTWYASTASDGYLLGSASLAGGVVDGVVVAGLTKEGRPVRAGLAGSELEGYVDEPGCPGVGTADEPCVLNAGGGYEQYHRGGWFVGARIDVSVVPYVDDAALVCSGLGRHSIAPSEARPPLAVPVRIAAYHADSATYDLVIDDDDPKGAVQPVCGTFSDASGEHLVPAVALEGAWNPFFDLTTGGAQIASGPDRVTFACTNAVLGECAMNGYRPWQPPRWARSPVSGNVEWMDPRALHQACTRMLRADYCGTGESFTIAGTQLDVGDRFGKQTLSAPRSSQ
jgi:hypothetical protein